MFYKNFPTLPKPQPSIWLSKKKIFTHLPKKCMKEITTWFLRLILKIT